MPARLLLLATLAVCAASAAGGGAAASPAPVDGEATDGWWPFSSSGDGADGGAVSGQLWQAAQRGDTARVKQLLQQGADIEAPDADGNSPLVWAAYHGHVQVVKLLLEQGADTESQNKEGNTPLIAASFTGEEAVLQLLLEHNADLEGTNKNGDTALIGASYFGQPRAVQLLLSRGANAETMNTEGRSPLALAHAQNHDAVARTLIEHLATSAAAQLDTLPMTQWSTAAVQRWVSLQRLSAVGKAALHRALTSAGIDGEALVLL